MNKIYDFGIIGGGPAGYTAAIRASQLGKSVVLFEKENLGGVCLNKGCIPTKTFLHAADLYNSLKKASNFGINIENYSIDFEKLSSKKEKVVSNIRKSLEMLLKSYDIEIVKAEVKILPPTQPSPINGEEQVPCPFCIEDTVKIIADNENYECKNCLVATGGESKCVGGFEFDHKFILSSDDVLELKELPKKVVIVGSGAIGVEWARIFSSFGVEVTVVEIAPRLLPLADGEISQRLERTFKMSRIKFYLETSVKEIKDKIVTLSSGENIEPDFVLFATGRKSSVLIPATPAIRFIGDAFGGIQLAHFAAHQGVEVVEEIVLGKVLTDTIIPAVVYGNPEVAWFGKTEEQLQKENIAYKKSVFPVSALGKAQAEGNLEGLIKILSVGDKITGVHIISKEASAMIHQLSVAAQNDLTIEDIKKCCFAHPTYSEGIHESILGLTGESLALLKEKK